MKFPAYAVLFVDDEPANRHAFRMAFEDRFRLLTAESGADALKQLSHELVAVVVSDQRMPEMTGVELCAAVRQTFPDTIRMIVTAYSDIDTVMDAVNRGQITRFFAKPWNESEIVDALETAIEAFQLQQLTRNMQARFLNTESRSHLHDLLENVLNDLATPVVTLQNNIAWIGDTMGQLETLIAAGAPETPDLVRELLPAVQEARQATTDLTGRIDAYRTGESQSRSRSTLTIDAAVHGAVTVMGAEISKRARLNLDLSSRAPVSVEANRIHQILANLLIVACENIEPFNARENLITVSTNARNNAVVVSVEDTGTPMTASKPGGDDNLDGQWPDRVLLNVTRDVVLKLGGTLRITRGEQMRNRIVLELPRG